MTRLLNFTKTQEKKRDEIFCVYFGMKKMGGLYNSGGGNMNGMPFNEG